MRLLDNHMPDEMCHSFEYQTVCAEISGGVDFYFRWLHPNPVKWYDHDLLGAIEGNHPTYQKYIEATNNGQYDPAWGKIVGFYPRVARQTYLDWLPRAQDDELVSAQTLCDEWTIYNTLYWPRREG